MVETIHIDGLQDACQLSPVRCADFAEAEVEKIRKR